jgi:hypothetical protein
VSRLRTWLQSRAWASSLRAALNLTSGFGGMPTQADGRSRSSPTRLPSRPGEFHPEPLTDPDLTLSRHPARATAESCRLPLRIGAPPVASWPTPNVGDLLPSLHGHYPASPLLRSSPPLAGALVLSASRLEPLVPFPFPSPAKFSRSARKPSRGSRRLHAGCRSGGLMPSPELFPEDGSTPGSDIA